MAGFEFEFPVVLQVCRPCAKSGRVGNLLKEGGDIFLQTEDLIMLLLFHHCTRIKSVVVLLSIDFTLKLIFISAEVHERYEGTFEEECRQQWCLRCHCEGCAGTYIVQKGSYTTL